MIDIKKISMRYGATKALEDVSFSVNRGEILGLLGPNGAGKSTLMKILTTFLCPFHGTAVIEGMDILADPIGVREIVGYMPENVPLYMDMRVDEYIQFIGAARGLSGEQLARRCAWVQHACGILPVWKHTMFELSKGFRQRVGLAQALIHDPKVLILDEPTSGLDPLQIIGIRKLIRELAQEKTIIFSTHILQEVEALADRIVIIHEGRIISEGSRAKIQEEIMKHRCHVISVRAPFEEVECALSGFRNVQSVRFVSAVDGISTFEIHSACTTTDSVWEQIDAVVKHQGWPLKTFMERPYNLEDLFISLLSKKR